MNDGVTGVDLLNILLSPAPDVHDSETPRYLPRRAPTPFELWRDEMMRRALLPLEAAKGASALLNAAQDVRRDMLSRVRAAADMVGATMKIAAETPLNDRVSPHRRLDWLTFSLEDVKKIRRAFGCSVNDVVLATVTGAMQRFLQRRQFNPGSVDFRVMAPVSVRTPEQRGALGNQVSAWILELPVGEPDPREQLRQIQARTTELKGSRSAVGAQLLTEAAEWGSSTLLALGARNVTRILPFNLVVTNVPGPQFPIYMAGARLLETFPLVPLIDNLGLVIGQMSYDGKLCWGFNADYDLIPDLAAVVRATAEAFSELLTLAGEPASIGAIAASPPPPPPAAPLQIVSKGV
jgi:WS/DGAT/MGAT family acyltransferase